MAKLSRQFDVDQRETLRIGVEARHNVHGIGIEESVDQMAGSFVGRMCLSGRLTDRQHEAARSYLVSWHDMSVASNGPRGPGAVNLNATKGAPGAENVDFSIVAMAHWKDTCAALQRAQDNVGNVASLKAALDYCVIRDQDHPHMLGWLRLALDALADHYRIGDKRDPRKMRHAALTA